MNAQIKQQSRALKPLAIVLVFLFMILIYSLPGLAIESTSGVEVGGDPSCEDVAPGSLETTIDLQVGLHYCYPTSEGLPYCIGAYSEDGVYFDWSSVTVSVAAVLVRNGSTANLYLYDPSSYGDTELHPPVNPTTGTPYTIGEITFCHDQHIWVTTGPGEPSVVETNTWGVETNIIPTQGGLVLSPGQVFPVEYTIDMWVEDIHREWDASGNIVLTNPTESPTLIESIVHTVGGIVSEVECDTGIPYEFPAGGELYCFWHAVLPDDSTRISLTEVITSGDVGSGFGEAVVDFAAAEVIPVDECVELQGVVASGVVIYCAEASPVNQLFSRVIGPYYEPEGCGEHEVTHTVSFLTLDNGVSGSASWDVSIEVPCETGCTHTPGYWKTHSSYGPAPYDDTWGLLDEDSLFFDTGNSWHEVLWTPPRGNAFYILAHAYGAAYLNGLNESDLSDVSQVLVDAQSLLILYDEAMGEIKGQVRKDFVLVAQILDDYNNGLIGPGSCSE